jgi:hypothetical protein
MILKKKASVIYVEFLIMNIPFFGLEEKNALT